MKKYLVLLPLIALILAGFFVMPVSADMPTPGPDFGPHIASMTPEHAQEMGAIFGHMVSNMAQGEDCLYHQH